MTILHTTRLRLEPYAVAHLDGLYAMNSQPEVMRYITGRPDSMADTVTMIERVQARWQSYGFSWWSFLLAETDELIGAGCIQHLARIEANPLEIGWRLHPAHHGCGYAIEAAKQMASFAFDDLQAPELLAVRHPDNLASGRVMDRLGMRFRGIEPWYEADLATHHMSQQDWRNR
jgi:RimJ/RimL family protein N-acetyltransferase